MSAALVDHLWQSSLFALGAMLLTMLLRKEGAHVRYWIWFTASVKFLIPFSLVALIGSQVGWHALSATLQIPFATSAHQIASPLLSPAATLVSGAADVGWARIALLVWAFGCAALMTRWLLLWLRVKATVRSAVLTATVESVPVMTSRTLCEPGVVGIVRPVLLLPEGIVDRLTSGQLQTILDHELCHVRRRDNLTAAIHMLAESVFWFHPLVWWIGARLVDERERACDEAVLRSGNEPRAYAEGILKVCQFYLASKLTCVSGVSGAQLKMRLEVIMRNRVVTELNVSKKILLSIVALAALGGPFLVGLTATAQAPASPAAATSVGKIELIEGKRVKLNFQNVEVRGLLKALAEAAHANMLVSDKVTGTVTLKLAEMPWEQALDVILGSQGLVKHEKGGIIYIEPSAARA
jgi:beta-lactamase regulating signal transducer with metallopeptidase domain